MSDFRKQYLIMKEMGIQFVVASGVQKQLIHILQMALLNNRAYGTGIGRCQICCRRNEEGNSFLLCSTNNQLLNQ
ncbi:hypothetical protein [Thermoactinomyces mirandus]|uniref:Uncharacterized protein n=1 Tax=Thermoactinomyces mirandus TaxID=2756294 RepID=A0A7W1XUM1_9BACL|nr:hypothetical protein [Thermoactinomyces mirandus]MBA4603555.1 hypothetical protein [Thermoactinomyces mirandus]